MKYNMCSIIIWQGKVFIPSNGRYNNGIFTNIEPIWVGEPLVTNLTSIVKAILRKEPKVLPDPTPEELKIRRDLMPNVTGARNWNKLCKGGNSYVIDETERGFTLEFSQLDSKNRWVFDPLKRKTFLLNTDLENIVQELLDDLEKRKTAN
jgi:hypothetical protein